MTWQHLIDGPASARLSTAADPSATGTGCSSCCSPNCQPSSRTDAPTKAAGRWMRRASSGSIGPTSLTGSGAPSRRSGDACGCAARRASSVSSGTARTATPAPIRPSSQTGLSGARFCTANGVSDLTLLRRSPAQALAGSTCDPAIYRRLTAVTPGDVTRLFRFCSLGRAGPRAQRACRLARRVARPLPASQRQPESNRHAMSHDDAQQLGPVDVPRRVCRSCAASEAACDSKENVSGLPCCSRCDHPEEDRCPRSATA